MQISRAVLSAIMAVTLSAPASAALRGDFAGLAICSKLRAMPQGYRPIACNRRAPLRGECRFALTSSGMPIEYLIEDGMVLAKTVRLAAGGRLAAPYGLSQNDDYTRAASKIWASTGTGLSSQQWEDNEEPGVTYLQSDSVSCNSNKAYAIYVWFRNGNAESVSVSTLPTF